MQILSNIILNFDNELIIKLLIMKKLLLIMMVSAMTMACYAKEPDNWLIGTYTNVDTDTVAKITEIIIVDDDDSNDLMPIYHNDGPQVFQYAEVMPEFPGGIGAIMQFLASNMIYPEEAQEAEIEGRVVVKFVVSKDGGVYDPQVVKGAHPSLDKEALRVVKMLPRFQPATNNGQPVNVYYTLPISFRLNK